MDSALITNTQYAWAFSCRTSHTVCLRSNFRAPNAFWRPLQTSCHGGRAPSGLPCHHATAYGCNALVICVGYYFFCFGAPFSGAPLRFTGGPRSPTPSVKPLLGRTDQQGSAVPQIHKFSPREKHKLSDCVSRDSSRTLLPPLKHRPAWLQD